MTRPTDVIEWSHGTGSIVIAGPLNIDTITWFNGGLADVVFSDSPSLIGAIAGHMLKITGATHAENRGSFLIVEVDPAAYRIRIFNAAKIATTSTYNEAASPGQASIENGGPARQEMPEAKRLVGFFDQEKPSAGQMNEILNNHGAWLKHVQSALPDDYDLLQPLLVAGNNVEIVDNGDGRQRINAEISLSIIPAVGDTFTQNSHGFVIGTPVRHNGTAWVAAQGTTMAGCQGVRIVTERTTNTFKAVQIGRVTIAATTAGALSTALVAGDLLYLSKTSGAVTTVKPVGDNSAPLGFHLPLFVVESVGGGQAVIQIIGQGYPTLDKLLAEHAFSSDTSGVTFAGLDIDTNGSYRAELELLTNSSFGYFLAYLNGETSSPHLYGVQHTKLEGATQTHTRNTYSNGTGFLMATPTGAASGEIVIQRCSTGGYNLRFDFAGGVNSPGSEYTQKGTIFRGLNANMTSLTFSGNTFTYRTGSKIRLYKGK